MVEFTHIQDEKAQMVDISGKGDVIREATAAGKIFLRPETLKAIREGKVVRECPCHGPGCCDPCGQEYSLADPDVPPDPHQCD